MRSIHYLYCSICGNRVLEVDIRICRNCGMIVCSICLSKQVEDEGICSCGSSQHDTLEEIKMFIIHEYFDLKSKIRDIALLPVDFTQKIRHLHNHLMILEEKDSFLSNPAWFIPNSDFDTHLAKVESYLTHYLQDFSPALSYVFNKAIISSNQDFLNPVELQSCQIKLRIISGHLNVFSEGTRKLCNELFSDLQRFEFNYQRQLLVLKSIKKYVKQSKELLNENEKIVAFSPIRKLKGIFKSEKQFLLVTTERLIFFVMKRSLIKKKLHLTNTIFKQDIKNVILKKNRRFKGLNLSITFDKEIFTLKASNDALKHIYHSINEFTLRKRILTISDWKLWLLGWSPEQFRLTINQLLYNGGFEHQGENSDGNDFSRYTNSFFNHNPAQSQEIPPENQEDSSIKKYFINQIESMQEQIQTCQYFLKDLVDRRSELPLTEYYTLYESFSLKLRKLEDQRDEILKQYQKLIPIFQNSV
ncbi:MAG: hypothetical protein ACFFD1_06885 [Candidatus Thorarchaeota archaeon]